jgi:hypothetical protein
MIGMDFSPASQVSKIHFLARVQANQGGKCNSNSSFWSDGALQAIHLSLMRTEIACIVVMQKLARYELLLKPALHMHCTSDEP